MLAQAVDMLHTQQYCTDFLLRPAYKKPVCLLLYCAKAGVAVSSGPCAKLAWEGVLHPWGI